MSLMPPDGFDGMVIKIRFELRSDIETVWYLKNPILRAGEPGVCLDTGKFKLGDGVTPWNDLEYYLRADHIAELVQQMIEDLPTGGGGTGDVTSTEFQAHIDSELPHPTYDDGTSFELRYQNAKV